MNIKQPGETGPALLAATPDVFTTLNWIVAHTFILDPKQKREPLHIVAGEREVSAEDLSVWGATYVTVAGSKMVRHVRRDTHSGAVLLAQPLHGLFDFMKYIVWPRMFDGRLTEFLRQETLLNQEEQSALDQAAAIDAERARLVQRDIERLLADAPGLLAAYHAVQREDLLALRHTRTLESGLDQRIIDVLTALADALADGNAEAVALKKRVAVQMIVNAKVFPDVGKPWQSDEYDAATGQYLAHFQTLNRLASLRYAKAFEDFCLSPQLLQVQSRLFADGVEGDNAAYAALVRAFVEQQRDALAPGTA